MAHELNFNEATGQYSFFSVKEIAWHGLGQIVQDYPTSAEALKFAHLDFTVEKRPIFTQHTSNLYNDGEDRRIIPNISVPDYFATVRQDNNAVLGVVGKDYHIVQNTDAFTFFDAIVGGEGIQYETAGALGKGERIFITAKLPGYIKVGNDDLIEKYLFFTTSHDGSGSITAAFTPVRVVCANTLRAALADMTNTIKIRHTANAQDRLKQAHRLMGISNNLSNEMDAIFNQWSKSRISDSGVKKLIQMALAPSKEVLANVKADQMETLTTTFNNMVEAAYDYGMSNPTQQMNTTAGTVFGAYNAVTGYFQNVRKYKTDEDKVKSILLGGSAQIKTQSAFDLCMEVSKKGEEFLQFNFN
ncbi:DUF932 domain-containing protein [Chitinophaga sancti]|uniref:DUF932 domain-containing protein n=1 Tax=Chitinophaga sancti TaxID=1004 RepID=UPI002A7625A4|nr:DUF932 domain-containing protein [Chitinophaga sancti]WPQ61888.1 DUF932 domain-containing protein [Chitinophaga sancti]